MALGSGADDVETLNAIFRAAHSIKGGSGTFGFTQLADATHEMETLFDGLRKGKGARRRDHRAPAARRVRRLQGAHRAPEGGRARQRSGDGRGARAAGRLPRPARRPRPRRRAAAARARRRQPTEESFFAAEAPSAAPAAASRGTAYGLFDEKDAAPQRQREIRLLRAAAAEAGGRARRRKGDSSSIRVSRREDRPHREPGGRAGHRAGDDAAELRQRRRRATTSASRHSLATLDRNTRDLQQAVMSIRMMPMEFVFSRFPRLVYDVSTKLGKKVNLRTQGHETELDKELIELLVDPLTHVVRNAIDHGIEIARGAPRRRQARDGHGRHARHPSRRQRDHRGLRRRPRPRPRRASSPRRASWACPPTTTMERRGGLGLIFEPGFSTAKEVTSLSGPRRRHGRGPPQHRLAGRQRLDRLDA